MILAVHHKYIQSQHIPKVRANLFSFPHYYSSSTLSVFFYNLTTQHLFKSISISIFLSLFLTNMASLIFKERKGINFSCTAPASTAVCTSIDRKSIVQPSSTRYLDRYTPHLRDPLRSKVAQSSTKSLVPAPASSATQKQKTVKHKQKGANIARRSLDILTVSSQKTSPPVSSRYLLNSQRFSEVLAESESTTTPEPPPLLIMGPQSSSTEISEESAENIVNTNSKSPPTQIDHKPKDQVVELRVSLHCKGCQAKVKKHLSKMEGVTSFNIDFMTKKVTVVGDVTPLGVLNSISKVKNAQFWPSPPSLSSQKFASYDNRY